ncbi:MAG: hypothetical protein FWC66_07395, partial [Oscillospiraceae bacterium]|nr:hypothetical protein [Oscillospiraceae bacterium]
MLKKQATTSKFKKIMAMVLAFVMVFGTVPITAMAAAPHASADDTSQPSDLPLGGYFVDFATGNFPDSYGADEGDSLYSDQYVVVDGEFNALLSSQGIDLPSGLPDGGGEPVAVTIADITGLTTGAAITNAINNAGILADDVTVTGTATITGNIVIIIPQNSTLYWEANVTSTGAFYPHGSGNLIFQNGGGFAGIEVSLTLFYGTVIIEAGSTISSSSHTFVIMGSSAATLISRGDITTSGNLATVNLNSPDATVIIEGGTVHRAVGTGPVIIASDGGIHVAGGTISRTDGEFTLVSAQGNATILVTGTPTLSGGLIAMPGGGATPTAFFQGNHADLFSVDFQSEGRVFNLDDIVLTHNYDPIIPAVGNVAAIFPAGFYIADMTVNPATATHFFADNVVTFSGVFNHDNITLTVWGTLANEKLIVPPFTTAPFGVNMNTGTPLSYLQINGEGNYTTVSAFQAAINAALENGDATVTGALSDATAASFLNIHIPANRTLTWNADYSTPYALIGSIFVGGNGNFMLTGGNIAPTVGAAIVAMGVNVTINNGNLTAIQYPVFATSSARVLITGGTFTQLETGAPHAIIHSEGGSVIHITGGSFTRPDTTAEAFFVRGDSSIVITGTSTFTGTLGAENTGIVIHYTGTPGAYTIGDDAHESPNTTIIPATATAIWARQDAEQGIEFDVDGRTGFVAVPGVTVDVSHTTPDAPQSFTAAAGDEEVTLSWTAPLTDGGSAITGYEVSSDNGET